MELTRTVSVVQAKKESAALPTDTVVEIHGAGVRPTYLVPWQVGEQKEWTGTGFHIGDRRILTNAHCVEDATVLQVTKQENPKKFRAHIACIAHDIDLAIVRVEDEAFWEGLPAASFCDGFPDMYTEVKAVGFPAGGSTVCVTKGVISRIDAQLYAHPSHSGVLSGSMNSPGSCLILQIDAAINPGNSGGPAFNDRGTVVGVASSSMSSRQNVGYVIPSSIAKVFVNEFQATEKWSGISETGFTGVSLENDSMRRFLKMGAETGCLVTGVAPMGVLHGKVKPGDVVTAIDGHDLTNEGNVPITIGGQKVYVDSEALTTCKPKGERTTFRVLREGEAIEVVVTLTPLPPLAPRFHAYDSTLDYVMVGGVVFTRGTVPLLADYLVKRKKSGHRFISDAQIWTHFDAYKKDANHELVVLLTILKHDVNLGYDHGLVGIVETFNGKEVRSLAAFAKMVGEAMRAKEEYLCFHMRREGVAKELAERPDIVLETEKMDAATQEICATNHIPAVASDAMLPHFNGTQ